MWKWRNKNNDEKIEEIQKQVTDALTVFNQTCNCLTYANEQLMEIIRDEQDVIAQSEKRIDSALDKIQQNHNLLNNFQGLLNNAG